MILPKGITPRDITCKEGPKGWKLAPTGRGYTVSGPKLAVGEDAEYMVTVRQLPDTKTRTDYSGRRRGVVVAEPSRPGRLTPHVADGHRSRQTARVSGRTPGP